MNKTESKHPLLTLGEKENFYLALSQVDEETFSYIYALLLKQNKAGQIILAPQCTVMTFNSKDNATLYFNTLDKLMQYQHNTRPNIVASFERVIEEFYEHTK